MLVRTTLIGAVALLAVAGGPALAQLAPIFGDNPPRPPGSVPGAPAQARPPAAPPTGTVQSQPLPPPNPPLRTQPAPGQPPAQAARPPQAPPQTPPAAARPAPGQPATAARTTEPPRPEQPGSATDEIVVAPPARRITNPTAVMSGLDKITGRIISFDVAIGETVQFGALQVTPRVCYSRPATESPQTTTFMEVDEITLRGDIRRIFTGWMYAASPGLHAVEHPIYDIWLVDCKGGQASVVAAPPASAAPPPPAQPPAPRRQTNQPQ
jgi:hypothetical protein